MSMANRIDTCPLYTKITASRTFHFFLQIHYTLNIIKRNAVLYKNHSIKLPEKTIGNVKKQGFSSTVVKMPPNWSRLFPIHIHYKTALLIMMVNEARDVIFLICYFINPLYRNLTLHLTVVSNIPPVTPMWRYSVIP